MTVIKESHASILKRKNLEQEKQRILNMDFKKKSDRGDWERLNKFLSERRSQAQSEVMNDLPLDAVLAQQAQLNATPGPNI